MHEFDEMNEHIKKIDELLADLKSRNARFDKQIVVRCTEEERKILAEKFWDFHMSDNAWTYNQVTRDWGEK